MRRPEAECREARQREMRERLAGEWRNRNAEAPRPEFRLSRKQRADERRERRIRSAAGDLKFLFPTWWQCWQWQCALAYRGPIRRAA
jgi:hypothetical protein